MSTIVDTAALGKVIGFSLAAGIGVSAAFSLVVLGFVRWGELRRESRVAAASAYGALALLAAAACIAVITYGTYLITQKS